MPAETANVQEPDALTQNQDINQLIDEITAKVVAVLHQTDLNLDTNITENEQLIAAKSDVFVDSTIPFGPIKLNDVWIDPSSNHQLRVNTNPYAGGAGVIGDWTDAHDNEAKSAADAATIAAGTATQTFIQDAPPVAAKFGDLWVETDNNNQVNVCNETYLSTDGPAPFATLEEFRESKFEATQDEGALLLAAAVQGLQDGKINQFFQPAVPAEADARDLWVDTDAGNQQQVCTLSYLSTDFGPPGFGGFANQTEAREAQWVDTRDQVAQAAADAADALADGKTETFFNATVPPAADIRDLWVDIGNSNIVKVANAAYLITDGPAPFATFDEFRRSKWDDTTDPAAQLLANDAQATADGKSVTYFQDAVPVGGPTTPVDKGDGWIDTDDNNRFRIARVAYLETDGPAPFATLTEFREDKWEDGTDKAAQDLANSAQSTADGKKQTFFQDDPPDPDVVGTIDIGDGWHRTTDDQFFISKIVQTQTGGILANWSRSQDTVAAQTATDAREAVDRKRTTYNTAVDDTLTFTKVPGPGVDAVQIFISFWSSIISAGGVVGAQIGDLWINIDPVSDVKRTKICIVPYTGDGGDPGAPSNWVSAISSDQDIIDALFAKYNRDGSLPLTSPIDFTPVAATQNFIGEDVDVDDGLFRDTLRSRIGGPDDANPGAPFGNSDVLHKLFYDQRNGVANGHATLDGSGKVPTGQLPALAITDVFVVADDTTRNNLTTQEGDVAFVTSSGLTYIDNGTAAPPAASRWQLVNPLINDKVSKAGDTMTGDLEVRETGTDPLMIVNETAGTATPRFRLMRGATVLADLLVGVGQNFPTITSDDATIGLQGQGKQAVFWADPTADNHLATKSYVDATASVANTTNTGSVAAESASATTLNVSLAGTGIATNAASGAFVFGVVNGVFRNGNQNVQVTMSFRCNKSEINMNFDGVAQVNDVDNGGVSRFSGGITRTTSGFVNMDFSVRGGLDGRARIGYRRINDNSIEFQLSHQDGATLALSLHAQVITIF